MPDPVDPFAPGGALEAAYFLFQELALPLPPVPRAFADRLREADEQVYSTRAQAGASLAAIPALADEAARGEAPPYLAFSYEGHGTNSWFVRYAAVLPHVAVFLELPFGGAYADPFADREVIRRRFAEAASLLSTAERDDVPPLVALVQSGSAGWCEVDGSGWTPDDDALSTLTARLSR